MTPYQNFLQRFSLFASKHPKLIINTLSNIFTMRLIGNKTHGDLAEVGIAEFVQQFIYDYRCTHVGKEHFRAKSCEEDILVIEELSNIEIPISLKAYGDGPLQLSTDKNNELFPLLEEEGEVVSDVKKLLAKDIFTKLSDSNVMPLIYKENAMECNIMVFDFDKMLREVQQILRIQPGFHFDFSTKSLIKAKGRKHPIYLFLNEKGEYVCEIRYGNASANALQRGLWTNTNKAHQYFRSITGGWISYEHNEDLVKLFRLALNSSVKAHQEASILLQEDIDRLKTTW